MSYKLKENYIYNTAFQLLNLLVSLATTPYVSRILGPAGVGQYSFTFSIVSIATTFAVLGGDTHGNRSIAKTENDIEQRSKTFWGILIVQLFSSIISIIVYFIYTANTKIYTLSLAWQSIHLLASLVNANWFFYGKGQFKLMVNRNIIIKTISVICVFIFVHSPDDVNLYIMILGLSDLLSVLIVWPFILKDTSFVRLKTSDITKHIAPMFLLFTSVLSMSLYKKMDKVLIGWFSNVIQNGYFENVDKIINVPSTIFNAMGLVMLPQISNMIASGKKEESKILINKVININIILSCAMCFGIIAISDEFVPLFFGMDFLRCATIMKLYAPIIIFQAFSNMVRSAYLIPHQMDTIYIRSTIAGAVVNLVVSSLLISKFGAIGATIGIIAAEAIVAFIQMRYIRNELPVKKYFLNTIPYIIFGSIMVLTIMVIKSIWKFGGIIELISEIFIGILVYSILSIIYIFLILKDKELIRLFFRIITIKKISN